MVFGFISNLIFGDQGNKNDQELILILCYFGFKGIVKKVFEFFSNHVLVHIMSIYGPNGTKIEFSSTKRIISRSNFEKRFGAIDSRDTKEFTLRGYIIRTFFRKLF